jgi:hypothetical protein
MALGNLKFKTYISAYSADEVIKVKIIGAGETVAINGFYRCRENRRLSIY